MRLLPLVVWLGLFASHTALALDLTEQEQAGKRLYREGVSSSDAQLMARVGASDISVPASVLPCASCHGNDGRGRAEGGYARRAWIGSAWRWGRASVRPMADATRPMPKQRWRVPSGKASTLQATAWTRPCHVSN